MLDYVSFFIIIVLTLDFFLLSILIFKSKSSTSKFMFQFFLIGIMLWCLSMILYRSSIGKDSSIVFAKILYCSAAIIPVAFTLFCEYFPIENASYKYRKTIVIFSVFSFIVISIICLFSSLIIKDVNIPYNLQAIYREKIIIWGNLYTYYVLYQNIFFTLGFIILFIKYKKSSGLILSQIQYILYGTLISVLISFVTNLFLPSFGIFSLNWVGQVSSIIWASFITYAIIRHRFLSITNLTNNIISILLNTVLLHILFYGLCFIYISIFGTIFTPPVYAIGFFIGILSSFLIKYIFNKTNSTRYISLKYDTEKYLNAFRNKNSINQSTNDIFQDFIDLTKKFLGVRDIELITADSTKFSDLFSYLKEQSGNSFKKLYLSQEDYNNNNIINENNITAAIYIYKQEKLIQILLIKNRNDNTAFNIEEIRALNEASERLNLAISRNILSEEQKRFNDILQKRLDEATNELQKQKDEIEDRFRTERDMVGIMGHELRTPLTTARGFLEIVMSKSKMNPDTPIREYQHYLQNIYDAFKREIDLVQTMLSTSHVDNNKLNLVLTELDFSNIIKTSIMDYSEDAEKKGLILEYHLVENIPHILGDASRTQEVTNNLVSNAIKYTPKGRVDIFVSFDDQFVYFSVKDTGEGIPENEIPNLGKKFYRVQNYISQDQKIVRPGGTGLGIYIVKAILEASGGALKVESKFGEGSTFTAVFKRFSK